MKVVRAGVGSWSHDSCGAQKAQVVDCFILFCGSWCVGVVINRSRRTWEGAKGGVAIPRPSRSSRTPVWDGWGVDGGAVARGGGEVRVVPASPVAFRAWRGNMPLCVRQRSVCGADLA